MKKTIALLAAICSFAFASAQEQQPAAPTTTQPQKANRPKPEMMASRHSQRLKKLLQLSDEQTKKTYDALLTRFTEVHAIREKAGDADRKVVREQTKPARQKFVQTMNTILTPEQKTAWETHRKEIKKNRQMRKDPKGNPPPTSGNGDIKKLTDDDDGIDE